MAEIISQEKDIFSLLKKGDEEAVFLLYRFYREEFIRWSCIQFNLRNEESADIFQDTVINLYFNIKENKIITLRSTLKTYLFAIGKNLILKKLRKDQRMISVDNLHQFNIEEELSDPMEASEEQKKVANLLNNLKEPCQSILRYFYFHNYSMEMIANVLGYKNQHVVKSQKLRCIKELKERMQYF